MPKSLVKEKINWTGLLSVFPFRIGRYVWAS